MNHYRKIFNTIMILFTSVLVLFTVLDIVERGYETAFDLDNIRQHIETLSEKPHSLYDDEANEQAFHYIIDELNIMGLANEDTTLKPAYYTQEVLIGDLKYYQDRPYQPQEFNGPFLIKNIVASIPANSDHRTGDAIMIMAHYDSVPMGPGASDDSAAVGVMLEAIRYYKAKMSNGYTIDNDLVFVFTDGEEFGLYGAAAFMGAENTEPFDHFDHLLDRIRFAVNLESRGTSGTLIMFETSPKNFKAIQLFSKINQTVFTSSIANFVYSMMPNGTDFSNYNEVYQGLNFANLGAGYNYHTQNDNFKNVGDTYLTQQANLVDRIICKTADLNLDSLYGASGNAIFFSYLNLGTVYYSTTFGVVLGLFTALLMIAVIALSITRKTNRIVDTAKAYLVVFASIIGSGIAALILYYVFGGIAALFNVIDFHAIGQIQYSHITIVLCIVLLSFVITALSVLMLGKKLGITGKNVRKAVAYMFAFLGILLSFVLPEASYLFVIPGILLLTVELLDILVKKFDLDLSVIIFGLAFSLVYPAISLATDALGLSMCYAFAGLSAILGLIFIPVHVDDFRFLTITHIRHLFKKQEKTARPLCGILNLLIVTLALLLVIAVTKTNISVNYQGKQSIKYLAYDDALVYVIDGEEVHYLVKDLDAYTYMKSRLEGFTYDDARQGYIKRTPVDEIVTNDLSTLSLEGNTLTVDRNSNDGFVDLFLEENQNITGFSITSNTYQKTFELLPDKNAQIRIRYDSTITFITRDEASIDASIKTMEVLLNYEPLKTLGDFEAVSTICQGKYNLIKVTYFN